MADSTGSIIESQVDWLTCSAHGEEAAENLYLYAEALGEVEQNRGNRVKPWRMMGYEGKHIGSVEFGRRDSASCLLRLIGQRAADELDTALSVAHDVTRLDIAVTWRAEPPDERLGDNAYTLAEQWYRAHPRSSLPSRFSDAAGGSTVYLGARASENFFRLYNKEQEARHQGDTKGVDRYRACWRYELETKGPLAKNLATLVETRQDRAHFVRDYIVSWVEAHGITAPFVAGQPVALLPGFRRRSDEESRLRHLARNVRPTVDWFREQGKIEAALDALGLSDSYQALT
jgi:hypothetical protein